MSTEPDTRWQAERLMILARGLSECQRFASPKSGAVSGLWQEQRDRFTEKERKRLVSDAARVLFHAERAGGGAQEREIRTSGVEDALQAKAAVELELDRTVDERTSLSEKVAELKHERNQARESLALQQGQIREFQQERTKLLDQVSQLESRLRKQTNVTEQVNLQFDKLKAVRGDMADQASEHIERISELEKENEQLRAEMEALRKQHSSEVASADQRTSEALGDSSDAVLKDLWAFLNKEIPEVFVDTHVPDQETFKRVCDALLEFLKSLATIEKHVLQLLKNYRQVSEQGDKLNHFFNMLSRNPGLIDTMRDYLITGRRRGNYVNLLRIQQAWSRAFSTGAYKAIVRSDSVLRDQLNYRKWNLKETFLTSEEQVIGKHFKEVAMNKIPDAVGTELRKSAADEAYDDYNALMKSK